MFGDWEEKSKNAELSKSLLWEYDLENFDWYDMRTVVVQRVIERGWFSDFYAAIKLYGGLDSFKNIIKEIPILSPKNIAFVCSAFELRKEDLKCYKRALLREQLLYS